MRSRRAIIAAVKTAQSAKTGAPWVNFREHVYPAVAGTLDAIKGDVESGLVGDLRRRAVGEVIADMLMLAKETLADGATSVAAVLAAAAFEDTIRRMASILANIHDRRKLSDVLIALKDAKALEGAQFGIGQSYLQFRNDAMHADWSKVDGPAVSSCIGFVEQLVLKHFS
ncbi:MAG: hypothetical protein ACRD3C_19520 [Vicinamibacterales bacterium]